MEDSFHWSVLQSFLILTSEFFIEHNWSYQLLHVYESSVFVGGKCIVHVNTVEIRFFGF